MINISELEKKFNSFIARLLMCQFGKNHLKSF